MSEKAPSPTRDEHFPKIDATPEQLAKALLRMGSRKPEVWEYMRERRELGGSQEDPRS